MADLEVSGAKEAAYFLIAGATAGVILALYLWLMRKVA
jgi:hypothetical protein